MEVTSSWWLFSARRRSENVRGLQTFSGQGKQRLILFIVVTAMRVELIRNKLSDAGQEKDDLMDVDQDKSVFREMGRTRIWFSMLYS